MSSGMQFMYGHIFGSYNRKPHIDTVRAIQKSNEDPYNTAPFGVDPAIAKPGPRHTPFLPQPNTTTTTSTTDASGNQQDSNEQDIDDIINMINNDPELSSQPMSQGQRMVHYLAERAKKTE